ncbi:MAG: hypothetical protein F6J97_09505 [Leptolyngbya sp. SIO4C1]|nr:hypothetical protein [Leptolyngbya sp. SIO4C1]
MKLSDTVKDKQTRSQVAADCVELIDEQVAAKGGLSGLALKAAYGALRGIGPSYVSGAIERLLPETLKALDPMWQTGVQAGDPVAYLVDNRSQTADTILSVTDTRIQRTDNGIVSASYSKLRKSIKGDVEAAVPGLAKIIDNHAQVAS